MSKPKTPAWGRVLQKVDYLDNGCWLFTGHLLKGYGYIWDDGKKAYAHQIAFRERHGYIPAWPMTIDHTCHNDDQSCPCGTACRHRACVNPDHLEEIVVGDNLRRSPIRNPTHCPHGHEYTPENTRWTRTKRKCKECDRLQHLAARRRNRGAD